MNHAVNVRCGDKPILLPSELQGNRTLPSRQRWQISIKKEPMLLSECRFLLTPHGQTNGLFWMRLRSIHCRTRKATRFPSVRFIQGIHHVSKRNATTARGSRDILIFRFGFGNAKAVPFFDMDGAEWRICNRQASIQPIPLARTFTNTKC